MRFLTPKSESDDGAPDPWLPSVSTDMLQVRSLLKASLTILIL